MDGSTGEVESIEIEKTSQEMYNLTVDAAHTFYVGEGGWLVHNACGLNPASKHSGIPVFAQESITKNLKHGEFMGVTGMDVDT